MSNFTENIIKIKMIQALDKIKHKDSKNFFLIAGPCAIESEDLAMEVAEKVVQLTNQFNIPYIFKGSFKKPTVHVLTVLPE